MFLNSYNLGSNLTRCEFPIVDRFSIFFCCGILIVQNMVFDQISNTK